MSRDVDESENLSSNEGYDVTYVRFVAKLMKPPYDTNCHDYRHDGFESDDHCYDSCLINSTIEMLQKVPFTTLSEFEYPYCPVSREDLKNETFQKQLTQLELACKHKCERPNCYEEIYIPKVVSVQHKFPRVIQFTLLLPNEPDLIATAQPLITTVDLITYILSCISFWFGFSPLQLVRMYRKRDAMLQSRVMMRSEIKKEVRRELHKLLFEAN